MRGEKHYCGRKRSKNLHTETDPPDRKAHSRAQTQTLRCPLQRHRPNPFQCTAESCVSSVGPERCYVGLTTGFQQSYA